MQSLAGKNLVVIGASRGVGRQIVHAAVQAGARVLAVARQSESLRALSRDLPEVDTQALDARDAATPAKVFERMTPDVLVIGGGAFPPAGALHELSWDEFSVNWENDARIAFNFLKAALTRPLPPGATVVLLSSGAGFAGSPNSGGYAAAKRAQIFMTNYAQKESDRLALGLRFVALAPRIMPDTELGKFAIAAYARYLGVTEADFVNSMSAPPSAKDAARAVMTVLAGEAPGDGHVFVVSGQGLQPAPT